MNAFISSTSFDLVEHRKQVVEACLCRGMFPIGMEHLPARDADAIRVSLEMVEKADIYLGIFGWRYGHRPKGHQISITEMEFNRAVERQQEGALKHILVFTIHKDHPLMISMVETDTDAQQKLADLKKRASEGRGRREFKSPEELRGEVIHALSDLALREQSNFTGTAVPPSQAEDLGSTAATRCDVAPRFSKDERIVKVFVGRTLDLERILTTFRKQRAGQRLRPKPGTSLFWFHGFGGMGKSWLLRRTAYLASKSRKKNKSAPAILLVDCNPKDQRWSPLGKKISDPQALFESIAERARQVYGTNVLKHFWSALHRFQNANREWADLRFRRFSQALTALAAETAGLGKAESSGADVMPVQTTALHTIRDRDILRGVLEERNLATAERSDLLNLCAMLRSVGPLQDEVFEAWAEIVVPAQSPQRAFLVRPHGHLADALRSSLEAAAGQRPMLLLLDTCEELHEWTEHWLKRLLVPILLGPTPIVVVIGARSRPDRYQLPGQRGGWLDELVGRIDSVAFDKGRHFTVSEIEELLQLSGASVEGCEQSELAERLHYVTRGVPFGLGLLVDRYRDLLEEVAKLDDIAGRELDETKAAQKINLELVARYLLHVECDADRADIYTIALLPGVYDPDEAEREWYFRSRLWNGERTPSDSSERFRDQMLGVLWNKSGWRTRLQELERKYGLLSDGDLDPIVRRSLRSVCRINPPGDLLLIVERLLNALDASRPTEGVYDQTWADWTARRIELQIWNPDIDAADLIDRAVAIAGAHGSNLMRLEFLRNELKSNKEESPVSIRSDLDGSFDLRNNTREWTPFENACLAISKAITAIDNSAWQEKREDRSRLQLTGVELIHASLEVVWPSLSDRWRRTIADGYLEAVIELTAERSKPEILEHAISLTRKLSLTEIQNWWGLFLHNQGKYEDSNTAFRAALNERPKDHRSWRVLIHNLCDHLDRPEGALPVIEEALLHFPKDPFLTRQKAEILGSLGRAEEGLSVLREAYDAEQEDEFEYYVTRADLLVRLGRLNEADIEYQRACSILEGLPSNSDEWTWCANRLAMRLYLSNRSLDKAEQLARQALKLNDSMAILQTLFGVLARAGKWDTVDVLFRRYLHEEPIANITGAHWKEDVLFFRDAFATGQQQWVADRITAELPPPRDDRWEIIRLALTGEVPAERLARAVAALSSQIRSHDTVVEFPTITQAP